MATREQLVRALQAADAAGNTEDATRLAAAIRGLPATGQPSGRSGDEVRAEYNALPWYRQAGQAVDDMARLGLNGITMGAADKYFEFMGQGGAERTQEARERAGFAGGMAEAAGNIATGAGASASVARNLPGLAGNTLSQTIGREGIAAGAIGAAAEGAKTGDLGDMASGGGLAALAGSAGGAVGKAIGGALSAGARRLGFNGGEVADAVTPARSTEQLRAAKTQAYDDVAQSGILYRRQDTAGLAHDLERSVNNRNPSGSGLDGARSAVNDLNILLGRAPAPGATKLNNPVSPLDVEDFRTLVRQRATGNDAERAAGDDMIRQLDDFMTNTQPSNPAAGSSGDVRTMVDGARAANRRYRSSQALDEADLARLDSANDQGDVNHFRKIIRDPKKRRLYPPEEVEVMRRIVRGESAENVLEKIGGTTGLVGLSGTGLMAGSAIGGVPGAIAGGALGLGARKVASMGARSYTDANIEQLRRIVGGGSVVPAAIRGPLASTGQAMATGATLDSREDGRERRRRRN